jgi:flagellar motility protein MotE (MotC chaperone)
MLLTKYKTMFETEIMNYLKKSPNFQIYKKIFKSGAVKKQNCIEELLNSTLRKDEKSLAREAELLTDFNINN